MQLTQAILPVAGLGTRFLPWTKVVAKELLPIGNRPAIALIVDECLTAGIREICFVINRGKESIPNYFLPNETFQKEIARRGKSSSIAELLKYSEVSFHTEYQEQMNGDGDAILHAKDWIHSDAVAVLFGDDIIDNDPSALQQMSDALSQVSPSNFAAMLCLAHVPRNETDRYGIVAVDTSASKGPLKVITNLVEKPKPEEAPSSLGIVGKYIVSTNTIAALATLQMSDGQELRLIDSLIAQKQGGKSILGLVVEGSRYDVGTPEGYRRTEAALGKL